MRAARPADARRVTIPVHPSMTPEPRTRPRWGRITRTSGRYGSSETQVVVYPPGSSSADRFWADAEHAVSPIITGAGIVAAVVLLGAGVPTGPAVLIPLALVSGGRIALRMRTADLRRRSAVLLVCRSELCPGHGDAELQSRVEELAERVGEAARACMDDPSCADAFDRSWREVFAEISALVPRDDVPGSHSGR